MLSLGDVPCHCVDPSREPLHTQTQMRIAGALLLFALRDCRCLLPGYFVMRFGKTPDSLIGNAAGLKEPVYTQVCHLRRAVQGHSCSHLLDWSSQGMWTFLLHAVTHFGMNTMQTSRLHGSRPSSLSRFVCDTRFGTCMSELGTLPMYSTDTKCSVLCLVSAATNACQQRHPWHQHPL